MSGIGTSDGIEHWGIDKHKNSEMAWFRANIR
jgi:hypothetical protein